MCTKLIKQTLNCMLYVILCVISLFLLTQKVDFQVDELLTYNLANADSWFNPESNVIYSPANYPFIEAMSSNGNFDLRHIWKQQAYDTHPPFYYVLVHAICTLFPRTVSVMYAGIINVVFLLATLFFYRKILYLLIDNQIVIYILSVMFVFSSGLLSIATFLRMYVMTMFWVTAITYIILKIVEKFSKRSLISLIVIIICGTLTHYYFLVYACLISLVAVSIWISEKKYKEAILYMLSIIISGGISFLIFPAMKNHILHGARGTQSLDNFIHKDLLRHFKAYFSILDNDLFGGLLLPIILIAFILLLIRKIILIRDKNYKNNKMEKIVIYRYICLVIPVFGYILLISKTAPYDTDRYISPIFAVAIAGVMSLSYMGFANMTLSKWKQLGIFAMLVTIISSLNYAKCDWNYLNTSNKTRLMNAEIYGKDANAICVYDDAWKINPFYLEIDKCKTSTFYCCMSYDEFASSINTDILRDDIAFFIIGMDANKFINDFLEDFPEYKIEMDNGQYGYGQSIYLSRGGDDKSL